MKIITTPKLKRSFQRSTLLLIVMLASNITWVPLTYGMFREEETQIHQRIGRIIQSVNGDKWEDELTNPSTYLPKSNSMNYFESGLLSVCIGAVSSILPEIIQDSVKYSAKCIGYSDIDANKYAKYAAGTAMLMESGAIVYYVSIYTPISLGFYLPFIVGSLAWKGLEKWDVNPSSSEIARGAVSAGTAIVQKVGLSYNFLFDGFLAMAEHQVGSTLALKTYNILKNKIYKPANNFQVMTNSNNSEVSPIEQSRSSRTNSGTLSQRETVSAKTVDSCRIEIEQNLTKLRNFTRNALELSVKMNRKRPQPEIFSPFFPLKGKLIQLSAMNLDSKSSEVIHEEMKLIMNCSARLRAVLTEDLNSEDNLPPNIDDFTNELEKLKEYVEIKISLEEKPSILVAELMRKLENHVDNISHDIISQWNAFHSSTK